MSYTDWIFAIHLLTAATLVGGVVMTWISTLGVGPWVSVVIGLAAVSVVAAILRRMLRVVRR